MCVDACAAFTHLLGTADRLESDNEIFPKTCKWAYTNVALTA